MAKITFGGKPANTSGDLPQNGAQTPSFTLVKNDLSEASLSEYAGKKVVLNIFPSVETSVCSTSVRKFNEKVASLDNTVVLCISKDLPFALARFCGAEGIENAVTLSGYRNDTFGKDYGVDLLDQGFKGLYARAVVVLDADHKVKYSEMVPEIGQEPNYEAALGAL